MSEQLMKTVFVIGAGASAEINMPTGKQLRQELAKMLDTVVPIGRFDRPF